MPAPSATSSVTMVSRLAELPTLGPHTVAVLLSCVAEGEDPGQEAWGVLSEDEQTRAMRFVHAADRFCFVTAHALMRIALGRQLGVEPANLTFAASPHGKPQLAFPVTDAAPEFSLSHTTGLVAFALGSGGRRLGVDVEQCRSQGRTQGIERVLTDREREWLGSQPHPDRARTLLRLWTRKEAALKADGRGLSADLEAFDVVTDSCQGFRLDDLELPTGFVGAVAYEQPDHPPIVVTHYV